MIITIILGLIIGSFLSAYTYRYPREIPISGGRSKCPKCNKVIAWYDNIPLLSYIVLNAKCRQCNNTISRRYPIIELTTAITFALVFNFHNTISSNILWVQKLGILSTPFYLAVFALLLIIFITDLEHQIIPDEASFLGWLLVIVALLASQIPDFYLNLASGLASATFFLALHLATKGKGMGLGDVKLALFLGSFFTFGFAALWILTSFILGAILGLFLLALKSRGLKDKIAFGPFMVIAFIIVLAWGSPLKIVLFPYGI